MMNLVLRLGSQSAKFREIILAQFIKDLILNLRSLEKAITIHLFQLC